MSSVQSDTHKIHNETFARCHERHENKAKICEKAEFARGK